MRAKNLVGYFGLVTALCGVVAPALADGLVQELRLGILDHDVPDLWSGFRAEPD